MPCSQNNQVFIHLKKIIKHTHPSEIHVFDVYAFMHQKKTIFPTQKIAEGPTYVYFNTKM